MRQITYYLSLGSNMGDRQDNLRQAILFLQNLGEVIGISSLYKTTPQDMPPGTEFFYNQVLCIKSTVQPRDLLIRIKEIEERLGRDLAHSHKQSRTIDIDILMADDWLLTSPTLTIPHPGLIKRKFVLVPLQEIAPGLIHPQTKRSISDLLRRLKRTGSVKKISPERSKVT